MKKKLLLLFIIQCLFGFSQTTSPHIIVDQFGYRPASEKIAVLKNPITGLDASQSFTPSNSYALVNAANNMQVYTGSPVSYNSGQENVSSGDVVWWFDFSSYQTPGTYYVLDVTQNLRSFEFDIQINIYDDILKHAVRTFYYQRAGYAKDAQYTGSNWADSASHIGTLQDTQCRRYDTPSNTSSEKDLSGGWYDAGDYNKYTTWTANYIIDLLKAYKENPSAWNDNYNLPYSGNGIPDILDEIKWGLDYLLKLQETNGSMISIVALSSASPPSSATGQSLYGAVNTSCTLASAAAFAYGSKIFNELGMSSYSAALSQSATDAWNWADANPNIIWENNSAAYNSVGIGAGQQETDDYGRLAYKVRAAVYLFDLTNTQSYKTFVESNYQDIHLILWNFAYPFEQQNQETLLYYATFSNSTASVASSINSTYQNAMNSSDNFNALYNESDAYLAYLKDYTWGSNGIKSRKGLMFTDYINYQINTVNNEDALKAAERYLHYIHGVNPLNFCYLSNMYNYGADNGVNEFYHTWFSDGTDWDNAQNDLYGPAPGFLTGGPNPSYNWDSCCPSGCSGCNTTQLNRIVGQPKQKAYDDFNTSWPMNSWEITENSNGYQVAYIRLLSKFVNPSGFLSLNEFENGTSQSFKSYPNPFKDTLTIEGIRPFNYKLYDITGRLITSGNCNTKCLIEEDISKSGIYFVNVISETSSTVLKVIKH